MNGECVFSCTVQSVVCLGANTHAVQIVFIMLDLLEKVWWTENAN